MYRFIISAILLVLAFPGPAQDFIGMQADEIRKQMRAHRRDFALDETTINKVYKYLKYVDEMETQTILFFLSDDDTCTYYKIIYDSDLLPSVRQELDSTCRKISDTLWLQEIDGQRYRKVLKQYEWFFSVTTRPEEPPAGQMHAGGNKAMAEKKEK